jgi:hypothetical protein
MMNFDPHAAVKRTDGQINTLLSILPFLTDAMQDDIVKAIHSIENDDLQSTLAALTGQYMAMIAQDYTSMDEYLRDMSLCKQFEDDELDRCWYLHHDPHADSMSNIEI